MRTPPRAAEAPEPEPCRSPVPVSSRTPTRALGDAALQRALGNLTGFPGKRAPPRSRACPSSRQLRDAARDLKNHILEHLDFYLETFEANVKRRGGHVHWAPDAEKRADDRARHLPQGRGEDGHQGQVDDHREIGLNDHLAANGIEPIETDLGEYIIQLRGEHPSHIIAPAIHVNLDQVSDAFHAHHGKYGKTERQTETRALMNEAREILRDKFIAADVGITGANFCIAETGTTVIVTNEGNGDLTQTLPRVHVAVTSIEKVVPTLEDATLLHRCCRARRPGRRSRSTAPGPPARAGLKTGRPRRVPRRAARQRPLEHARQRVPEMLRCIRCSACMNHCPVYRAIGGHAYGWVYPGPMGSVLTPAFIGVEQAGNLPNASTFCGRCESVAWCIPLPKLMRLARAFEFEST